MSERVVPARSPRLPPAQPRAQADRRRCLEWPASSRRPAPCPHRKDRPPLGTSVCCPGPPTELAVPPTAALPWHAVRACGQVARPQPRFALCGLPIDKENLGEGEHKVGALLQGHVSVSRSVHLKTKADCRVGSTHSSRSPTAQSNDAQEAALGDAPVATYGFTIFFGSTTRSNSASVTKPSFKAAALSVRSLSIA